MAAASLQIGFHPLPPNSGARLRCFRPLAASPDSDLPLDGEGNADPVKLAFARAEAYRRQKLQAQSQKLESSLSAASAKAPPAAAGGAKTKTLDDKPPTATIIVGDPTKFGNRRRRFEEPEKDGETGAYGTTVQEPEKDGETGAYGTTVQEPEKDGETGAYGTTVQEPEKDGETGAYGTTVQEPEKDSETESYAPKVKEPEKDGKTETYQPKVKTWGVFPRPSNISKAYGGGRVIRPGDILETKEAKEAKEKRSRELIAAYRKKMGLDIDPKIIAECQKYLREANELMDKGNLRQALPFYEKVMKDMIFESELHGRAALQLAFCLDSLQRSGEAKVMYEKLQNHPNSEVSTKARHFAFSFKAMEFMKVRSSYLSRTTGYEMYFDSFVDNKEVYTSAKAEPKEAEAIQVLPYIVFLVSPL